MKFKFDRTGLLKLICLIILIAGIALGGVELLFLVDLGGVDFAVTFLVMYFASIRDTITFKYQNFKVNFNAFITFLSELYMFQPKVFLSHATASSVFLFLTCSVFIACLLWVPVIYVSSVFIS